MTVEDFERNYAAQSGVSVVELRELRAAVVCACGDPLCEGFAIVPRTTVEACEHDVGWCICDGRKSGMNGCSDCGMVWPWADCGLTDNQCSDLARYHGLPY